MNDKKRQQYNSYMARYMLKRYRTRMQEAKRRLGGKCVKCGTTKRLEIDHKDWNNKTICLSRLWNCAWAKFISELGKCQLLCNRCHIEKSRKDLRDQVRKRGWKNQHGSGPLKTDK